MDNVSIINADRLTAVFAVKSDGTLWAWGGDYFSGSLGIGNIDWLCLNPTKVMDNTSNVVVGNEYVAYALKTDGTLWAWGNHNDEILGVGTTNRRYYTPVKVM